MEKIKIKVEVTIPTTFELEIIDKDLWESRKNDFYSQCNAEKDMGSYIISDYCCEEYGIKFIEDTIDHKIVDRELWEYRDVIQIWDENGNKV